ncbi:MAG: hypothetical protein DIU80_021140 [Chloroflexota bacterium]
MNEMQSLQVLELPARRGQGARARRADDWKARAVARYQERQRHEAVELRDALARRLHTLTGLEIAPERIWVDRAERIAGVTVDGVHFRWESGQLTLVRPCELCGIGEIASKPLHTQADIGYALSDWQPRHPACQPEDPANWLESE